MLTRIGLFLATNIAVLFILNLLLTVIFANQAGTDWMPMLLVAGIIGFAGSFISLMMSKTLAKRSAGARVISQASNNTERWLLNTVKSQANKAGIGMPEVAIFASAAPNAFATGASKDNSLVAVSTGLLEAMTKQEVEAVLAHEISHIANGDMVTLSLLQGVVNTFVIVLAHIISSLVDHRQGGYGRGMAYHATYMLTQLLLGVLATLIVRWFSRWREYRADAGGAALAGSANMIAALQKLQSLQRPAQLPKPMQALGINGGLLSSEGFKKLMMTHPPLAQRIQALRDTPISTNTRSNETVIRR